MDQSLDHGENILVTGAIGFIGSHFTKLLSKEGYHPVILDKKTYASDIRRIEDIKNNVSLYIGNICDNELIENIIQKHDIDTIVNFAAETHVDNSIKNSEEFITSNIVGAHILLEACRKNDIRKFIQISTDEVYGSSDNPYSFREYDVLKPSNPYSSSKASADLLALSYCRTYDLYICITRSSNNYGPWQNQEKFIPRMIKLAMDGKSLEIYGNGKNVRDWIYVTDNCRGIKAIMDKGEKGGIYNICGGNERSNNQIATIISKKFGVDIKYIKDRPGHDFRYSISDDKIRERFEWRPKVEFEDGINDTIAWYINQYNKGD